MKQFKNFINMKRAKNLVWTGLLIIAMSSVVLYDGNNDAIKLALLLANFLTARMWLYASSWGCAFRKFIISLINSNS